MRRFHHTVTLADAALNGSPEQLRREVNSVIEHKAYVRGLDVKTIDRINGWTDLTVTFIAHGVPKTTEPGYDADGRLVEEFPGETYENPLRLLASE